MWLKRKDILYNLDHFDSVKLDYEYENNRYYFVLMSATRENRDREIKIGPFSKADATSYLNQFIAALDAGAVIWEFPEKEEQL